MLGSGTQTDPYLISTPNDLNDIRKHLTAYYKLVNDIDMSSWGNWLIILNFKGQIDGDGHVIKNLTNIGTGTTENVACGFVSNTDQTKSFTIKNLGLVDINFNNSKSAYRAGGLFNYAYNATIENCYVTGTINVNTDAGGIGGLIRGNSVIRNCWTNVKITANNTSPIAGIVPSAIENVTIENCYSIGQLNGVYKYGISSNTPSISNNNFWNIETMGTTQSACGIGKTTAEMKQQSTFTGWDFTNIWGINGDYPYLRVFGVPVLPPQNKTVNVKSYVDSIISNVQAIHPNKATMNVSSYMGKIDSKTNRALKTSRQIISFINPIYTKTINQNKRVFEQYLTSYISALKTNAETKRHVVYHPIAFMKRISGKSDSIIPAIQIDAHSYYMSNETETYVKHGSTSAVNRVNPSFVKVVE